jgi:hypothetical protein
MRMVSEMPNRLNVKKMLRDNPQVDRKLLAESEDLSVRLRKFGRRSTRRILAGPFDRKRVTVSGPATIKL